MADLKDLVSAVHDSESLCDLLRGLGWPVLEEFAFEDQPEIAKGVKGHPCKVSSLIPASSDDERLFLLVEFEEEYIRRDLREILASLRRYTRTTGKWHGKAGTNDTIFVVVTPEYDDVRFVLFEEQAHRLPRIRSFGWRKDFVGRTVLTHNLERLRWEQRITWESAWDVEALTDTFYKDYEQTFNAVLSLVVGGHNDKERKDWTQLLFNRLLFIAFIQRMDWLQLPGGAKGAYLFDLFKLKDRGPFQTISAMLRAVFTELDTPETSPYKNRNAKTLGEIPYLNGGLFDQDDPLDRPGIDLPDEAFKLVIGEPDGLFARYNFTVTESTPLDQEVAVDPEMLGKIFERLINAADRHGTGTYYTPRPIVEFMVNEALKGYLIDRGLAPEKAKMLVDDDRVEPAEGEEGPSFRASELQDTLDWLFEVRAVDPACGSGAYLLMLLQRLFECVDRLEVSRDRRRNVKQKHLYETKLRLLQGCVYGVDLSEEAVRIAKLRLWLSLVVENNGQKPEPLPNFDFLIMCGDSLASPLFPAQGTIGHPTDQIREYTRLKRRFFHPTLGEGRPTRTLMSAKRKAIETAFADELSHSTLRSLADKPFDWEVDFAEIFDPQDSEETIGGTLNLGPSAGRKGQGELAAKTRRAPGFDIVLANPPYVNANELLQNTPEGYKNALAREFPNTGSGTADLLVYFMDRAFALLRPGGQFAFITSNKWLKAGYGKKLRGFLATKAHVNHLIDFGDLPVFAGTIAYPLITLAIKKEAADQTEANTMFTSVSSLEAPYPDLNAIIEQAGNRLPSGSLGKDGIWKFETGEAALRVQEMRKRGIPLGEYVNGRIFYGIKTGLNEVKIGDDGRMYGKTVPPGVKKVRKEGVFVIDGEKRAQLIAEDPRSAELIKPLAVGKDLKRWHTGDLKRWIIVCKIGTDMSRYPAVMRHLSRFENRLVPRADQGNHWWELRACAYYEAFEDWKIAYPDMFQATRFSLLPPGTFLTNTAYLIPGCDLFLLGILNSHPFFKQLSTLLNENMGKTSRGFTDRFAEAIIPRAEEVDKRAISELVENAINETAVGNSSKVEQLEVEIDLRVEYLYFYQDRFASFEDWVAHGDAIEQSRTAEIRALVRKGECGTIEFKQSLEYVDLNHPKVTKVPAVRLSQTISEIRKDLIHSVLKTVVGFINSQGGTLLIGVHDTDGIWGLEGDFALLAKKKDQDEFQLKLVNLLKDRITPIPTNVDIDMVEINEKWVCRVEVPKSLTPHYLDNCLFIRIGSSTHELKGRDLEDWMKRRWQE